MTAARGGRQSGNEGPGAHDHVDIERVGQDQTRALTQPERARATRQRLLRMARGVFGSVGYEAASLDAISRQSGVTKGGLYHHFPDKRALFRAVVEDLQKELSVQVRRTTHSAEADALDRLLAEFSEFLDACTDPAVYRVLLEEGPAVLGWEEWRMIDDRYWLGPLSNALAAIANPEAPDLSALVLAHLVSGAVTEGARVVARSTDPTKAKREVQIGLGLLLHSISAGAK